MKKITHLSIVFTLIVTFNSFGYNNWFRNWTHDEHLRFDAKYLGCDDKSEIVPPKGEVDLGRGLCCLTEFTVFNREGGVAHRSLRGGLRGGLGVCGRSVAVVHKNAPGVYPQYTLDLDY